MRPDDRVGRHRLDGTVLRQVREVVSVHDRRQGVDRAMLGDDGILMLLEQAANGGTLARADADDDALRGALPSGHRVAQGAVEPLQQAAARRALTGRGLRITGDERQRQQTAGEHGIP
jgi:hypothetical protein